MRGFAASNGVVEGPARVVKSVEEIGRLRAGRHSRLPDHQPDLGAHLPEDRRRGVRHRRLDEPRRHRGARVRPARGGRHRHRHLAHQGRPAASASTAGAASSPSLVARPWPRQAHRWFADDRARRIDPAGRRQGRKSGRAATRQVCRAIWDSSSRLQRSSASCEALEREAPVTRRRVSALDARTCRRSGLLGDAARRESSGRICRLS